MEQQLLDHRATPHDLEQGEESTGPHHQYQGELPAILQEQADIAGDESGPAPGEVYEDWSSGLYRCLDAQKEALCEVCLCHPCNVARQVEAANEEAQGPEGQMNPVPCLGVIVVDAFVLCLGSMFAGFLVRRAVREKFGIYEEECKEFGAGCCCFCCSLCQTHRELRLRGHPPRSMWPSLPVRPAAVARRSHPRARGPATPVRSVPPR